MAFDPCRGRRFPPSVEFPFLFFLLLLLQRRFFSPLLLLSTEGDTTRKARKAASDSGKKPSKICISRRGRSRRLTPFGRCRSRPSGSSSSRPSPGSPPQVAGEGFQESTGRGGKGILATPAHAAVYGRAVERVRLAVHVALAGEGECGTRDLLLLEGGRTTRGQVAAAFPAATATWWCRK